MNRHAALQLRDLAGIDALRPANQPEGLSLVHSVARRLQTRGLSNSVAALASSFATLASNGCNRHNRRHMDGITWLSRLL
jgi:hypothetical protein